MLGRLAVSIISSALAVVIATGYAVASIRGLVPLPWSIFSAWLTLLVAATSFIAWELRRRWSTLSLAQQLISLFWIGIAVWYWTVAPFYFSITMNLTPYQIAWTAFAFFWEVPVVGGGAFVAVAMLLARPFTFYDQHWRAKNPAALYHYTFHYPGMVAALLFAVSILGYVIGALQLRFFTQWPFIEQVKNVANGAVVALFLSTVFYQLVDNFLNRVREALERQFTDVVWPTRRLRRRLTLVTGSVVVGNLGLLGLIVFTLGQYMASRGVGLGMATIIADPAIIGTVVSGIGLVFVLTMGILLFNSFAITRGINTLRQVVATTRRPTAAVPGILYTGDEIEAVSRAYVDRLAALSAERSKLVHANVQARAIIDSVGEGLVVTDQEERVVTMNRRAEELSGWVADEVIGRRWHARVQLQMPDGSMSYTKEPPLHRVLRTGQYAHDDTFYYRRRDGSRFPVSTTAAALVAEGETIGAVLVFHDITHEKAIDRAKTEFVSLASHQLRTPLTAINWYLELLLSPTSRRHLPREQQHDLERIYQRSQRMTKLVNDLLNVSRLDAGRLKITPRRTDVGKFVASLIAEFEEANPGRCQIRFTPPSTPLFLAIDATLLQQVIVNLLHNAMKYTPPVKQCDIAVALSQEKSGAVVVAITDTGVGISAEARAQVFKKFYRGDEAVKLDTEGTGLGLYTSRLIVEQSGGTIWFDSKPGQGTTFYIRLPREGMREKGGAVQLASVEN